MAPDKKPDVKIMADFILREAKCLIWSKDQKSQKKQK